MTLDDDKAIPTIRTKEFTHTKRQQLYQTITEGGHLSRDSETLRSVARQTLAYALSCRTTYDTSGLAGIFAGAAIGADVHLPNMATEEILWCLSKTVLEHTAAAIGLPPGQRAKDTRAPSIPRQPPSRRPPSNYSGSIRLVSTNKKCRSPHKPIGRVLELSKYENFGLRSRHDNVSEFL